ncbi:pimeloyl-ACP methyl ester carboxylesterase [Asanoa ferruginea]|uniref:Pimeloyl-ACP methyl ester carboxylesterase n=1 Tax=Asanoa ferruginea TaxID=53367 RepID=A0A3D9ZL52_9ACTN|nr:alpha/beta hydrolase [Asanoa ferruginea]REF97589.1 pimeloyl-ACP methyl ester carboxylesterase [Asanoa ferruginea]GIF48689.1 alpha/beta hydrolase [Asanoa ferruginea]
MEQVRVQARGIDQNVLVAGPADGPPVLMIHGNCSSADFWRPLLGHLPPNLRIVAPDLRGYGATDAAPVDATRGLRDFADDVAALLDAPELFPAGAKPLVVAHSMGCGVAMQLLVDHPDRVGALLLEAPLSPYGFGGTRDLDGTPTTADFAGTGAGTANPDFVARLAAKDRGGDEPTSPRTVMRTAYVADPASLGDDEELLLDTVLSTVIGDDNYPGTSVASANWPGVGPGDRGVLNTMAPNHFRIAEALVAVPNKPHITWVRGDRDAIVSDTSLFDLSYLGSLGFVPGWPGAEASPPQPMVGQTRAVFDRYEAAGGGYREVVYAGCGHSPHLERPAEFVAELLDLVGPA